MQLASICTSCMRAVRPRISSIDHVRSATRYISGNSPHVNPDDAGNKNEGKTTQQGPPEAGAMSRRLSEMTEEIMDTGGRSARKAMKEAGFSEELKKELEDKIAKSSFKAQNQQAFSIAEMPSSAGAGTRAQAAAQPWTGTESLPDSALRMLDDSHKRLRGPSRPPRVQGDVNLRPAPKPKPRSAGERLANARDRTSRYALSQDESMTEKEREQMRKELKERFTPGARPMPTSLQGLTSLANERIEDAIARGQFKNIPRGKGTNVERDHTASSPFLDTTEYFMNKIIQRQDIVPPWIEKQQELVKAVQTFRSRLRNDWRRHAARLIASRGGSVQEQVEKARAYALAEEKLNPRKIERESVSEIDSQGNLVGKIIIEHTPPQYVGAEAGSNTPSLAKAADETVLASTITVTEEALSPMSDIHSPEEVSLSTTPVTQTNAEPAATTTSSTDTSLLAAVPSPPAPFRDPSWESLERSYHNLAISSINSLTRSYNLMAPKVAQKPYTSLQRELLRCYADVAPQLPAEIGERARRPAKVRVELSGHRPAGVLERFAATERVKVFDEDGKKAYGFKEFWRDFWGNRVRGGVNM